MLCFLLAFRLFFSALCSKGFALLFHFLCFAQTLLFILYAAFFTCFFGFFAFFHTFFHKLKIITFFQEFCHILITVGSIIFFLQGTEYYFAKIVLFIREQHSRIAFFKYKVVLTHFSYFLDYIEHLVLNRFGEQELLIDILSIFSVKFLLFIGIEIIFHQSDFLFPIFYQFGGEQSFFSF